MLYLRERNRDQPRPRQTLIDQLRTKIVQPPTHPSPPPQPHLPVPLIHSVHLPPAPPALRQLAVERCFDLQLLNELSGSRLKPQMEAYISMLEEENKLANLHLSRLTQPPPAQQPSPKDCHSQLQTVQAQLVAVQAQLQSAQCALSERESTLRQKTTAIEHLHRFFEDCREVLISTLVELGSLQRGSADAGGIERCLQRGEQAVSVLGEIVRGKGRFEENAVLEELAQQVKYYQKMLQLQKQPAADHIHENKLLRYELARLTQANEAMLKQIHQLSHSQLHVQGQSVRLTAQPQQSSVSTTASRQSQVAQSHFAVQTNTAVPPPPTPPTPPSPQLKQMEQRINILQVEKEYISDQLVEAETEINRLRETVKATLAQRSSLQRQLQLSREQEQASSEQIELLQVRIRQMEAPPEQQGSVTVEHLLRFLGRRELRHFHAALMELIGQYEQRISELTTHYQAEREVKEAQAAFLKSLQGVAAGRHATLREVAEKLNTYTQEVPKGIEDDIEICLRKVRCLAIGIDHAERDNIRSELEEYVLQLQARLPVLSQEYFQDGSSVAESQGRHSHMASVDFDQ